MDDLDIMRRIDELADEEHALEHSSAGQALSHAEVEHLRAVEFAFDRCWALLQQRRARQRSGADPVDAAARPQDVAEGYQL